jgi:superfamily II DNA/RNA helicase
MAADRPSTTLSETTFASLGVPAALVDVLAAAGVTTPFPIQAATLPDSLAGRDVLGRGRTGSGKTYAFVLPMLARLAASRKPTMPGQPRALILAPTRELASQIDRAIAPLAKALRLTHTTVFGGVSANPQLRILQRGVDVVVACPGRLEDHLRGGHAGLGNVEITVLDEADHMADLGFLPAVQRLLKQTPRDGQRMLFSATLDRGVDGLVRQFLREPVTHEVDSGESRVTTMEHHVLHIRSDDRLKVLADLTAAPGRTLVFTRTKQRAKRLTRDLITAGIPAVELHGNLAQNARERNMLAFSDGRATTLVATDIAARGIHVDGVTLVVHADPPVEHKAYVHRSGRTARAGADGLVVTLMTDDQVADVRALTRRAAISPTTTRVRPGDALLSKLVPGTRTFVKPAEMTHLAPATAGSPRPGGDRPRRSGRPAGRAAGRPRGAVRRRGSYGRRTAERAGRRSGGLLQWCPSEPRPPSALSPALSSPITLSALGIRLSGRLQPGGSSGTRRPPGPAVPGRRRTPWPPRAPRRRAAGIPGRPTPGSWDSR